MRKGAGEQGRQNVTLGRFVTSVLVEFNLFRPRATMKRPKVSRRGGIYPHGSPASSVIHALRSFTYLRTASIRKTFRSFLCLLRVGNEFQFLFLFFFFSLHFSNRRMAISDFLDFRTNIFISIVFKNIVKAIGCERFNRYKILKIRNILTKW